MNGLSVSPRWRVASILLLLLLVFGSVPAQVTLPMHSQLASGSLLDRPITYRQLQHAFSQNYGSSSQQGIDLVRARIRKAKEQFLGLLTITSSFSPPSICTITITVNGNRVSVNAGAMSLDTLFDQFQTRLSAKLDGLWSSAFMGTTLQEHIGKASATALGMATARTSGATPGAIIASRIVEEAKSELAGWLKLHGYSDIDWTASREWCTLAPGAAAALITGINNAASRLDEFVIRLFESAEQAVTAIINDIEGWIRLPDANFSFVEGSGNLGGGVQISYQSFWGKVAGTIHGDLNPNSPVKGITGASVTGRVAFDPVELSGLFVQQWSGRSMNWQWGMELAANIDHNILIGLSYIGQTGSTDRDYSVVVTIKGASPASPIIIAGASYNRDTRFAPLFQIVYPLSSLE